MLADGVGKVESRIEKEAMRDIVDEEEHRDQQEHSTCLKDGAVFFVMFPLRYLASHHRCFANSTLAHSPQVEAYLYTTHLHIKGLGNLRG